MLRERTWKCVFRLFTRGYKEYSGENLSLETQGPKLLRIVRSPMPKVGKREVLLKMGMVAISDLDLAIERFGKLWSFNVNGPLIMGTQGCGMVIQSGPKVQTHQPGDRVVVNPFISCGKCEFCKNGKEDICSNLVYAGIPPFNGMMTKFFKHPCSACVKIPDRLPMKVGCLIITLARCIKVYQEGQINSSTNVVILGCGILGQTMLKVCKTLGVGQVVVTDKHAQRVSQAEKLGADYGFQHDHTVGDPDFADVNMMLLQYRMPDVIIDTIARNKSTEDAMQLVKENGIIILTTVPENSMIYNLDISLMTLKRLQISAPIKPGNAFWMALNYVKEGVINMDHLDCKFFPLQDANLGFDEALKNQRGVTGETNVSIIRCSELE